MRTSKIEKIAYFVFLLLLAVFLILKVQRGFTDTEDQGGFWNIIQGIFTCSGLYACFTLDKKAQNIR